MKGWLKFSDAERATLGEIGHRLGRKVLEEVANVAWRARERPILLIAGLQNILTAFLGCSSANTAPGAVAAAYCQMSEMIPT